MKYIVELKKYGRLRGEMVTSSEEEAAEYVREWNGRCNDNTAGYYRQEKIWFAIYSCGELESVVDDDRWEDMKRAGAFDGDTMDWAMVRDGKFYETLSEATMADLERYGVIGEGDDA